MANYGKTWVLKLVEKLFETLNSFQETKFQTWNRLDLPRWAVSFGQNFDKILKSEKASRKPQKWTTPSKKNSSE